MLFYFSFTSHEFPLKDLDQELSLILQIQLLYKVNQMKHKYTMNVFKL